MSERLGIVALAPNPWFGPWKNRQQLLSRLAQRGWPIVYSTGPLSLWYRHRSKWQQAKLFGEFAKSDGLIVDLPGRWPFRWPNLPLWDRMAIRSSANRLRGAMPEHSRRIAYLFHPSFLPLVDFLDADFVVYHAFDLYSATISGSQVIAQMETELIDRADLVIGTTQQVIEAMQGQGSQRAKELLNAADSAAFARGVDEPCPDDLAVIPEPRIGYIGNINMKVDFDVISAIAEARTEANWVLIGPTYFDSLDSQSEGNEIVSSWRRCSALPNVHWLGQKEHTELPAYVGHMTVNTMCYKSSEGWWTGAYPLKLHENLATGKPVVSVTLDACRHLSNIVDFASSKEDWLRNIDRAINEGGVGTPDERQAIAMENTWDRRVAQLETMLLDMIGPGTPSQG